VALGVSVSSLVLLAVSPDAATTSGFPLEGIASAFIWNLANTASAGAIMCNGLAVAQGMWAPMIAFTSFVWNVAAFGNHPNNLGLTILGLLIMSLGCVALAYIGGRSGESAEGRERGMSTGGVVALSRLSAKSITSRASGQGRNSGEVGTEMLSNKLDVPLVDGNEYNETEVAEVADGSKFKLGLLLTVVTGFFAGSLFVPLQLAPADVRDGLNVCE
jgi:hypothetical protein